MAYDANRRRAVLFGGDSLRSALFNDTWEWDGEYWTQMADIGPRPRRDCSMTYDTERQQVALFGGRSEGVLHGDTWVWNGENWTQVADSGPPSRYGHGLSFFAGRKVATLFGGESDAATVLGDTWEWDGEAWTQAEDSGPSARKHHMMAYDTLREHVVLFGGESSAASSLGDTWEWDGTIWTQVSNFGADPCLFAAMVFKGDRTALYGGVSASKGNPPPKVFGDTWEWDGKHWTQRQDIGPGLRWGHAMTYDSIRGCIVLAGGVSVFGQSEDPALADQLLGDTWEHSEPLGPTTPSVTVASVTFVPPIIGPLTTNDVTCTITLSGPAPREGITVSIKTDVQLGDIPASVEIAGSVSQGGFNFHAPQTPPPGKKIDVTATLGASSITGSLKYA
jgi:hypothetical protein